jgi:predicted methyltransferase
MSRVVSIWIAVLIATFLTACGDSDTSNAITEPPPPPPPPPVSEQSGPSLAEIAEGAHRSDDNKARNVFRHPVETLEFFGLKSDMRVVEIWPAGGWYTEVIAPYMQNKGKYIAAHWDPQSDIEFVRNGVKAYQDKLAVHPEAYKNVEMAVLMYPDKIEFVPPGSVDMVLTFRNIHNWMGRDFADEIFASMYAALKPGGILGVVEHRGNPEVPQDPKASSGYVNQDYAIALAEKAGFVLEATSEINANPKDRKDYATGVWTLPPTLRAGDENRDEYLAIGESDRFTLKFVKPDA